MLPLKAWIEQALSGTGRDRPVRVVRLSPEQWSRNMRTARAAARLPEPSPTVVERRGEAKKEPEAEPPKPQPEDKLTGQVVEVPPTADDSPNPSAKLLSKYNTHVEKESMARIEERNPAMKRVTNKLQTMSEPNATDRPALVTPNITIKGDGLEADREGTSGEGAQEKKQKFVLELPDLQRRDAVRLKLGEGPGLGQNVANRSGSESMRGNASSFNLQLGSGSDEEGAEGGGGKKGTPDGADKPLPTLSALMPSFGVQGKVSGSPSRDHVDGVPEGDGTFLNTKEFKYATFFYRVRDSVASYWEDLAASEYRRRDPTGNIYGIRDRSTLLRIQLNKNGGLDDVRVEQTSGVDFLDHVAVEAFRRAEPFPNPPAGIADEDGNIRFNFQFIVSIGSHSPLNFLQFR